jgi:hypothetical protein
MKVFSDSFNINTTIIHPFSHLHTYQTYYVFIDIIALGTHEWERETGALSNQQERRKKKLNNVASWSSLSKGEDRPSDGLVSGYIKV